MDEVPQGEITGSTLIAEAPEPQAKRKPSHPKGSTKVAEDPSWTDPVSGQGPISNGKGWGI